MEYGNAEGGYPDRALEVVPEASGVRVEASPDFDSKPPVPSVSV